MATKSGASQIPEGSPVIDRVLKAPRKAKVVFGTDRISRFLAEHQPETPCLIVDLDIIESNYRSVRTHLPTAKIFYAVKANPARDVVRRLVKLGSNFDVASPGEIDLVMSAGAKAEQVSFGNTIKKERDIEYAYKRGVRLFAFDSAAELQKIARSAPGSRVFCRILTTCDGADWPLSRKFGCEVGMAHDLLLRAKQVGLEPVGVSFHVGSQQTRLDQWHKPLQEAAELFAGLKKRGVTLSLVNIGGGLPARYRDPVATVESYARAIQDSFAAHFGEALPDIIIEPGRSLVGDSGVLEAEVVLISKKGRDEDVRWVFLDIGKFGGLAETLDEAIKYRIETLGRRGPTGRVIIAGPSCDSADILYEKFQYELPLSLKVGDKIRLHATGAYTASYSSVGFNGFAPLKTYCI